MHYSEQTRLRITLCDLLIGRSFRLGAASAFEDAELSDAIAIASRANLSPERQQLMPLLGAAMQESLRDSKLARAAHLEWLAGISERGEVHWGGRFNRCGFQAAQLDATTDAMTWEAVTQVCAR
jgi:hypothetical protein